MYIYIHIRYLVCKRMLCIYMNTDTYDNMVQLTYIYIHIPTVGTFRVCDTMYIYIYIRFLVCKRMLCIYIYICMYTYTYDNMVPLRYIYIFLYCGDLRGFIPGM